MITSRSNQRLKHIRRLKRSKGDQALLGTPHLVDEALTAGLELSELLVTSSFLETAAARDLLTRTEVEPVELAQSLFDELADSDTPQGVLAVAELPRAQLQETDSFETGLWIYVEGLQDPGNLGALARSAEAAGARGLMLSVGTVHPNHPRALRASAGSLLRLPVFVGVSTDAIRALGQHDPKSWVGLVPRGGVDLYEAELPASPLVVLGAERGLAAETERQLGVCVTIPMARPVESLNSTVAASLVLFEWARRNVSS